MSSKSINKSDFTVVGKLTEDCQFLEIEHYRSLRRVFKNMVGKELEINFKPIKYQRSLAQNRWLWGVAYVTIAAWWKETNGEAIDKDSIHAHTLQKILEYGVETKEIHGVEVIVVKGKSTSKLTTVEFMAMKEALQLYWGERGCVIPDPKGHSFLSDYIKDE